MNSRKMFLKEAGVLLLAVMMVLSSGVAIAKTNNQKIGISITDNSPNSLPINRGLVWDNVVGVVGSLGGIIVATVRAEGIAFPADDFMLDDTTDVDSVFWQGGYFQCQLADGQKDYHWDWRIIFWDDYIDSSHPNNEIHNWTIPDAAIQRDFWYNYTRPDNGNEYWVANYSVQLPQTVTFTAGIKYWITIQAIQGSNQYPQGAWCRHNDSVGGIKLHEAVIKAAWWQYPEWTNISVLVTDKLPHDLNYQLYGPSVNNPPGAPTINGPAEGKVGTSYPFIFNAVDPDGDQVKYIIDWGDTITEITVLNPSGTDVTVPHTWSTAATFTITAKAQDSNGLFGPETTKTIIIKKSKELNLPIFKFLQNHPNILQMLKYMLRI